MTFDNTTYDQLAEMTADVLAQVVAAEPEVRSNDDKGVDEEWFTRWWWLLWGRWQWGWFPWWWWRWLRVDAVTCKYAKWCRWCQMMPNDEIVSAVSCNDIQQTLRTMFHLWSSVKDFLRCLKMRALITRRRWRISREPFADASTDPLSEWPTGLRSTILYL